MKSVVMYADINLSLAIVEAAATNTYLKRSGFCTRQWRVELMAHAGIMFCSLDVTLITILMLVNVLSRPAEFRMRYDQDPSVLEPLKPPTPCAPLHTLVDVERTSRSSKVDDMKSVFGIRLRGRREDQALNSTQLHVF